MSVQISVYWVRVQAPGSQSKSLAVDNFSRVVFILGSILGSSYTLTTSNLLESTHPRVSGGSLNTSLRGQSSNAN